MSEKAEITISVLIAAAAFILGNGVGARITYIMIKDRLREVFVSKEDKVVLDASIKQIGDRIDDLEDEQARISESHAVYAAETRMMFKQITEALRPLEQISQLAIDISVLKTQLAKQQNPPNNA